MRQQQFLSWLTLCLLLGHPHLDGRMVAWGFFCTETSSYVVALAVAIKYPSPYEAHANNEQKQTSSEGQPLECGGRQLIIAMVDHIIEHSIFHKQKSACRGYAWNNQKQNRNKSSDNMCLLHYDLHLLTSCKLASYYLDCAYLSNVSSL